MFEGREQRLRREIVYYSWCPGQFEEEEAIKEEEDVSTGNEGPGTCKYNSENS